MCYLDKTDANRGKVNKIKVFSTFEAVLCAAKTATYYYAIFILKNQTC